QGVQSDVELLRNHLEIGSLVVPIRDEAGNVVQLQHHVGMTLEWLTSVPFLVLAADSKNDATLPKRECIALKRAEGFAFGSALAEANATQAIVSDDTAPEGVVEIQHKTFLRLADH